MKEQGLSFSISERIGNVSGLELIPEGAEWMLVLAHGAGAGMQHEAMESYAHALADRGIATFRYNFPYIEEGKKRPDPPGIAHAAVKAAIKTAGERNPDMKLLAGGKSFGGRMSSQVAAENDTGIKGLVFFGFPLHAPGKPGNERADHLYDIKIPMLFLQGTRDSLAKMELIKPLCKKLELATLHVVEGGDHSFKVRKSSGRSYEEVIAELGDAVKGWISGL